MVAATVTWGTPVADTATTLTASPPAGGVAGDWLILAATCQTANATDWSGNGVARIGNTFVANDAGARTGGLYAVRLTGAASASYTFTNPVNTSRCSIVLGIIKGADATTLVSGSSAWAKDNTAASTSISVAAGGVAGDLAIEQWVANYSSPQSYALSSTTSGLTLDVSSPTPAGAENTAVSRTMMRLWSGIAPTGGVPAHTITTTGSSANRAAFVVTIAAAATNAAPTANAGPDQSVASGATVTLTSTGSADSDGTIASRLWSQISGTAVTLSSTTATSPTFTAPTGPATLVFGLTVTDNLGSTSTQDTVQITVGAPNPQFVASGGAVSVNTAAAPAYPAGLAAEDMLLLFLESDSAVLPTISGWTASSIVTGGGVSGRLYSKTATGSETGTVLISGITGGTKGAAYILAYRRGNPANVLTAFLTGGADTNSTSTAYSATSPAVTTATKDTVVAGTLSLAPSGTYSGNLGTPTISQAGGTVVNTARFGGLTGTNTLAFSGGDAQVTAGATGALTLAGTAAGANAAGVTMFAVIHGAASGNVLPVPNAGSDQTVAPGATVTLDGSGSTDADGTVDGYFWDYVSGPTVTLSSQTAQKPTFTAPAGPATLVFRLYVSDNLGALGATQDDVTVTVTASNAAPTVSADKTTVYPGEVVTLTVGDTDGTIASVVLSGTSPLPTVVNGGSAIVAGHVGDSLTEQSNSSADVKLMYEAMGFDDPVNSRTDGLVGRSIVNAGGGTTPSSETVINTWRTGGFHPNFWVIALCSNDFGRTSTQWKADIKTLLQLIATESVTRVLWIGPAYGPTANATVITQTPQMYTALNDVAVDTTGTLKPVGIDLRVFDLQSAFQAIDMTGLWLSSDSTGRHMTAPGYLKRNEVMAPWIQSLLPASGYTFKAPPVSTDTVLTATATDDDAATGTATVTVKASGIIVNDNGVQRPAYVTTG
jgi:hypothetical protein